MTWEPQNKGLKADFLPDPDSEWQLQIRNLQERIDEQNPECAWVGPGVSDEVRMAVDNSLCVCKTTDGGKSWKTLTKGLPQENVFDITYRHALDITGDTLAFGTTTGNLYLSTDRGDSWDSISNNLPMIHSLMFY